MTERELQLLGFEINYDDGGGNWDKYHYYTHTVAIGVQFISNASDEIEEGEEWYVEFFDSQPTIRFYNFEEVQTLINLFEKRIVKQ